VVLDGAAARRLAHELDQPEPGQDADVVADVAELLAELGGELLRTGLARVEDRQNSGAQRVSERGDDPLIRDGAGSY
jgi:hypothetical protein